MSTRTRETIVVCGPEVPHTGDVIALLGEDGWNVTPCCGEEALLEIICEHRPRAIVYALAHQLAVDLALLTLLRQVAPDLPVVVVASAERGSAAGHVEATHAVVLERSPADRVRLREALRAATSRRRRSRKLVAST